MFGVTPLTSSTGYGDLTIKTSSKIIDVEFSKSKNVMVESIIFGHIVVLTSNDENTSEETQFQLFKYISSKIHTDTGILKSSHLVYLQILKRAKDELMFPDVLHKCIELIKQYFNQYPPTMQIMVQIDVLCDTILSDQITLNKLHLKDVMYVQRTMNDYTMSNFDKDTMLEFNLAKQKAERDRKSHKRGGEAKVQAINDPPKEDSKSEIFQNLYSKRARDSKIMKSVLETLLFGGQFRHLTRIDDKVSQVDLKSVIYEDDPLRIKEKINQVRDSKRGGKNRIQSYLEMQPSLCFTMEEIQDSDIPPNVFSNILDNISSPGTKMDLENSLNILIHVFGDFLFKDQVSNFVMSRYFFFELLESNREVRMRAYNILYNTMVYLREKGGNSVNELFKRFCEMALYSFFKELDHSVWTTIFLVLNGFVSDPNFQREYLYMFDVRVIGKLLEVYVNLEERVEKYLICILTNILYENDVLNIAKIHHFGGIDAIIDLYVNIHSIDSKQNLFLILYDWITGIMISKKSITVKQCEILFELITATDLVFHFEQTFKYLHDGWLDFAKFLSVEVLYKCFSHHLESISQDEIMSFCFETFDLSVSYQKMEGELTKRMVELYNEKNATDNLKSLKLLLSSDVSSEKKNGVSMLFSLLQQDKNQDVVKLGELVLNQLVSERKNSLLYCQVVEKLCLLKRAQFNVHRDEKLQSLMEFLNSSLNLLVQANESNQATVKKMFYVIMDFCSIYHVGKIDSKCDDICTLFRDGFIYLPTHLVRRLSSSVLYFIFVHCMDEGIKIVSLILLMEVCQKKSNLDEIGGFKHFLKLLDDASPAVAFYASTFVVGQFSRYMTDDFHVKLNSIVINAQVDSKLELLDNEYFQATQILE